MPGSAAAGAKTFHANISRYVSVFRRLLCSAARVKRPRGLDLRSAVGPARLEENRRRRPRLLNTPLIYVSAKGRDSDLNWEKKRGETRKQEDHYHAFLTSCVFTMTAGPFSSLPAALIRSTFSRVTRVDQLSYDTISRRLPDLPLFIWHLTSSELSLCCLGKKAEKGRQFFCYGYQF